MKILHSADWHLGKNLEGHSRIKEQTLFLQDFCKMADDNNVDLVIIAGDIYDQANPPIEAERLLFDTLKKLSNNGTRLTLLIAGNHDSPEKLVAASPLAMEHGIIMVGTPKTIVPIGDYGKHKVINSGESMIEIEINGENAVILTVPYPSEKRLNEVLYSEMSTDEEKLKSYNDRMVMLFDKLENHFRKDTINLVTSHLFTLGVEKSDSERSIELGGSFILDANCFPKSAQYVALGHIHKPQVIAGSDKKVRYSGSPIHYNKKEINFEKQCILVEVYPQKDAIITSIPVPVYKPIEILRYKNVEDAIKSCEDNQNRAFFAYLEIEVSDNKVILEDEIKAMRSYNDSIISIIPIRKSQNDSDFNQNDDVYREELSFDELFKGFYKSKNEAEPSEEILKLLYSIINDENNNQEVI